MTTEFDTTLDKDAELEARIHIAYHQALCDHAPTSWALVAALIKQRSPDQVQRMEKELGIG